MVKNVTRREKTHKRRYINRKQRRQRQGEVQKRIDEAIIETVRETVEQVLKNEVTQLLGRAKGERRDLTDRTVVVARCNKCQTQHRSQFYRDGFYQRGLLTFEVWGQIKAPRVSCVCGGMVDFEFVHLAPYGRVWFDLEERARELAGLCVSLRDSVEVLAWRNGQPLSIATLNGLVNKTAELAEAFHTGELKRIPPVVMLDGIWLKVLEPTDEEYVDKKGRKRRRYKRRKFPLLVAFGVDPESGQKWVLDWERGKDEDEESWKKLLERLLARGLHAEKGLKLFVNDGSTGLANAFELVYFGPGVEYQRCVFHKLRNVRRDVVGSAEMNREQRQERRKAVLAEATEVYRGQDEGEIRRRLEGFRAKWGEKEPKAVATLERDFDQTLVYLKLRERARLLGQDWKVEYLRTTSALERVQRQFRQKANQVMIFHANKGVGTAIELVIRHRGLAAPLSESWARLLEEALLAA